MRSPVLATAMLISCLSACTNPGPKKGPTTLSGAFTLYERRMNEKDASELDRTLVDYKSEVVVVPDLAKIKAITGSRALSADERRIRRQTDDIVQTLERSLRLVKEHELASRAFHSTRHQDGIALQDDPIWRAMASKELEIVTSITALGRTYVSTIVDPTLCWDFDSDPEASGVSPEVAAEANDKVDALYLRMSPAAGFFDAGEITKIANELAIVFRQRLADSERLVDDPDNVLDMGAALLRGKDRLPISIDPYVHVENANPTEKSKRVGLPNPEDLERLKQEYEANAKLAKSLNELRELARDKQALVKARDAVLATLKTRTESLQQKLGTELKALISRNEPELAAIQADATKIQTNLERMIEAVRTLVSTASSTDPITLISNVTVVTDVVKGANLVEDLLALGNKLEGLPSGLAPQVADLATRATALFVSEADQLAKDLQDNPAAGPIGPLVAAFGELKTLAKLPAFADLKPGAVTTRSFPLAAAPAGVVNLADTAAEPGDMLELRQEITKKQQSTQVASSDADPTAGDPTKSLDAASLSYRSMHEVEVRKYGLYSTFGPQLLFYDRLHDGSTTYSAAAGMYYNFHYRPESWTTFFDVVAPGIGLGVSAPSFEEGTELAIGVQLTLLNDVLQVGFARNLSVHDDADMFYFGFDLIEAFRLVK